MDEHHTGAVLDPPAILAALDRGTRLNSAVMAAAVLRRHRADIDLCICGGVHPVTNRLNADRWQNVAEQHTRKAIRPMFPQDEWSPICDHDRDDYPCLVLTDVIAQIRDYLTTTAVGRPS